MKSVLVTCPPMLAMIEEFVPQFERAGFTVDAPTVVQTLSEQALVQRLPQHDGWIIGDDPATRKVFESGRAGRLRAAVKWGVGVDNVDFAAAADLGIAITHTPAMFGHEVADVAMAYVIGLARDLYFIDRRVRAGDWPKPRGMSLHGKTAGLVGYGDIGSKTAQRLIAAGLNVIVYDPAVNAVDDGANVQLNVWPDALNVCDFLIFTCSLTPSNRHMLDDGALQACKSGVRIVNVARGPLIDELALIKHLKRGHVTSAALDVMDNEPLAFGSPLRDFEHCILGSHNASNTLEAVRATSSRAMEALFEFLR